MIICTGVQWHNANALQALVRPKCGPLCSVLLCHDLQQSCVNHHHHHHLHFLSVGLEESTDNDWENSENIKFELYKSFNAVVEETDLRSKRARSIISGRVHSMYVYNT